MPATFSRDRHSRAACPDTPASQPRAATPGRPPGVVLALLLPLGTALVAATLTVLGVAPAQAAEAAPAPAAAVTETRAVAGFDGIAVQGSIDVTVRPGGSEGVTLVGEPAALAVLETVVEDRVLKIRVRRGEVLRTRLALKATVDVARLTSLASTGSGDLVVQALQTPRLKASVTGSGDVQLQSLTAESLELRVAGSGNVRVDAGTVQRLDIGIAGSGNVRTGALSADEVVLRVAGSGDAEVTAHRSLAAVVAGSGDVSWGGRATQVSSRVAGSGSVTRR